MLASEKPQTHVNSDTVCNHPYHSMHEWANGLLYMRNTGIYL